MKLKKHLINFSIICGSLLFTCLALEIMLRFLPVSSGISVLSVDEANPVFRAIPDKKIRYSRLWNFKNVRIKNINNAGFVNPQNYTAADSKPLLAVVGDSYVEAMIVQDDEAYPAILQNEIKSRRVYSFGFSGAPLSQYLIWAQYAQQNFHNQHLIINVVGNDFDESLQKYYSFVPGFHLYVPNADGELQLQRTDWKPAATRELAKKSYLLNYLIRNVEIGAAKNRIKDVVNKSKKPKYVANTSSTAHPERVRDSYQAIDAFFRDLPQYSGLDPKHIMFVLDDRTTTYQQVPALELQSSYFYLMKQHFLAKAQQLGYQVVDMSIPFAQHYAQHGKRFEFTYDTHWNSLGHEVVADAILESQWWQDMLSEEHFFAP